ncbi:MAG: GNAT family N-acetyltransferase [Chloroflexi bacterium]|nr:GNAT family N-acetyltransferase [Chloroflexota bacterium]
MTSLNVMRAGEGQKKVLARLLELYQYDLSDVTGKELAESGLYGYVYLDDYWREEGREAYLFLSEGKLAGFALVNRYALLPANQDAYSIAEFFVLKTHRRRSIGTAAAREIIRQHQGKWEIRVFAKNEGAIAFWRQVIRELGVEFVETLPGAELWQGVIFSFTL